MGSEDPNGLPGLHQQRLVALKVLEGGSNRVKRFPGTSSPSGPPVDD